jgi:arabinose-5-phosphate isomerase
VSESSTSVASHLERARRVFQIEIEELQRVAGRLDEEFARAAECIRSVVDRRGKVVVLGVGKSGHVGDKIAATLTSTGTPAVVLNSLNALHGDLGVVADGDVVLALSYGGETQELLNILPALARFEVTLVALTGQRKSSLARAAGIVLDVSIEREACPLGLAPTSSTTAMLVLGDALAMAVLEARGFKKEDFVRFHPGGSLGRALLTRVAEIMRPAVEIPLLAVETPIVDVIKAITRCRAGAAVLVTPEGGLAGIFTQGDFARHFPEHPHLGQRPVGDFMTPHPITIGSDRLAAEVLHILRTHRIDDLVVVDNSGQPVGLIDSQDLSRMKIL